VSRSNLTDLKVSRQISSKSNANPTKSGSIQTRGTRKFLKTPSSKLTMTIDSPIILLKTHKWWRNKRRALSLNNGSLLILPKTHKWSRNKRRANHCSLAKAAKHSKRRFLSPRTTNLYTPQSWMKSRRTSRMAPKRGGPKRPTTIRASKTEQLPAPRKRLLSGKYLRSIVKILRMLVTMENWWIHPMFQT